MILLVFVNDEGQEDRDSSHRPTGWRWTLRIWKINEISGHDSLQLITSGCSVYCVVK